MCGLLNQLKGIKALGTIAAEADRDQRVRNKGQAHTGHFNRSHNSEIAQALTKAGVAGTILAALLKHHKSRIVVLRACWALEGVCNSSASSSLHAQPSHLHCV